MPRRLLTPRAAGRDRGNAARHGYDFGIASGLCRSGETTVTFDPNIMNRRGGRRPAVECQPARQHANSEILKSSSSILSTTGDANRLTIPDATIGNRKTDMKLKLTRFARTIVAHPAFMSDRFTISAVLERQTAREPACPELVCTRTQPHQTNPDPPKIEETPMREFVRPVAAALSAPALRRRWPS